MVSRPNEKDKKNDGDRKYTRRDSNCTHTHKKRFANNSWHFHAISALLNRFDDFVVQLTRIDPRRVAVETVRKWQSTRPSTTATKNSASSIWLSLEPNVLWRTTTVTTKTNPAFCWRSTRWLRAGPCLDSDSSETIAPVLLFGSRLDDVNSILRLLRVQNFLARVITRSTSNNYSSLNSLHCLTIGYVKESILVLTPHSTTPAHNIYNQTCILAALLLLFQFPHPTS